MSDQDNDDDDASAAAAGVARRRVLTGAGIATASAAVVPLLPRQAEAFHATDKERAARYQDTPHVQRFYALNRR